jgi:4-hydroxy-3-methylbut-2-enyl diphosphate reductase
MKVVLAKNAGFCMGVRRAVETTLEMIHEEENGVATFGPLIHNPQVLDMLEQRGVKILQDIPDQFNGTVIIRAHGVPPEQKVRLQDSGARIKDATCPRVVKVQAIIRKYRKQGYGTIIIGDRNHAEVVGLMGYAGEKIQVVSSKDDIAYLAEHPEEMVTPYIIVSQTTQDQSFFEEMSRIILDTFPGGKVFNTICDSTHKRQNETRELSNVVDAVVVVGGLKSANTKRLAEIVGGMGRQVYLIETEAELDPDELKKYKCIGVTAGASTPTWLIDRVVKFIEAIPGSEE